MFFEILYILLFAIIGIVISSSMRSSNDKKKGKKSYLRQLIDEINEEIEAEMKAEKEAKASQQAGRDQVEIIQTKPKKKDRQEKSRRNAGRQNRSPNQRRQKTQTPFEELASRIRNVSVNQADEGKTPSQEDLNQPSHHYHDDLYDQPVQDQPKQLAESRRKSSSNKQVKPMKRYESMDSNYHPRVYTPKVNPKKLQEAVILKEILDKPKSLQ